MQCLLCLEHLKDGEPLPSHLPMCCKYTKSCPHCRRGVQAQSFNDHVTCCPQHLRECYVCHRSISLGSEEQYLDHVMHCSSSESTSRSGNGKRIGGGRGTLSTSTNTATTTTPPTSTLTSPRIMYHGTSASSATAVVASKMFIPSIRGLLGAGVYVTSSIAKAKRYGPCIIECAVFPGKIAKVTRRFQSNQKSWASAGYDSAWIPPDCYVSNCIKSNDAGAEEDEGETVETDEKENATDSIVDTRGRTGGNLEEHCVYDPLRVYPLRIM